MAASLQQKLEQAQSQAHDADAANEERVAAMRKRMEAAASDHEAELGKASRGLTED